MKLLGKYEDLIDQIKSILSAKPECLAFVLAYGEYIELIDDAVDEPKNVELIDRMLFISSQLWSSNYWRTNSVHLMVVEQLIHIIYFNSVTWETAPELWKRRDAKALSHCGYYMLFAILLLETGDSKLVQRISLQFMEKSHAEHLKDMLEEVSVA